MRRYTSLIGLTFLSILALIAFNAGKNESPSSTQSPTSAASFSPVNAGLKDYYAQDLLWKDCDGGFECSVLSVPLDYANPNQRAITISVIRLSSDTAVGSLLLNPGGPGGSGIEYVRAAQYVVSSNLIKRYDIIGFDPRGVGQSTPVECLDSKQTDEFIAADGSPDNQQEIDQSVALSKQLANGCAKKSPAIFAHVDTVSAARDIDILRSALGDKKLNWLGKSYGTFLGATYADLFPKKVGRMVLDGAIDPTLTNEQLSLGQALGFENALRRFVENCATHADCPLDSSGPKGIAQVAKMLDNLDAKPGRLSDDRVFTQAMGVTGVLGSLYDKVYGWPQLRADLSKGLVGDYSGLGASLDLYISRDQDGTYKDNSNDAIAAVNCLDRPDRPTVSQTKKLAADWKTKAPLFGEYLAWSNIGCSFWSIPATGVPGAITATGSPEILVVGTVNDPATPMKWAKALASQLSKGKLLTLDGDGHTAYMQGSKCIDQVVDEYFVTGKAKPDITCTDGP
jgi:pimeloyl-ACP methyl ester carboxylesterase